MSEFSYKFDPNKKDEFVGDIDDQEQVVISGDGIYNTPRMPEESVLANNPYQNKNKPKTLVRKNNSLLTGDVGIGSKGFANMISVAIVISAIGLIIAYLVFKM